MMRRLGRFLSGLFLALFLVNVGFAVFAARMALFPPWYKKAPERHSKSGGLSSCTDYQRRAYVYCEDPQKSLGLNFHSFDFQGVSGWWIPAPNKDRIPDDEPQAVVVLVHGGGADRRAMLKHAAYLHKAGFHSILIDCQNHGLSSDDSHGISFGLRESLSVLSALEWAERQIAGTKAFFIMGTSQGAFTALRAAAFSPLRVRGVIAENSYHSVEDLLLEFPALEWLPHIVKKTSLRFISLYLGESLDQLDAKEFALRLKQIPVFLIHGKPDKVISYHHSEILYELFGRNAHPRSDLWISELGEHEQVWNANSSEYEKRVTGFITQLF